MQTPPGWLQNAGTTHTASQLRMYMASLTAGNFSGAAFLRPRGGVHPTQGNELVVTQTGSPSMGVLVDTGSAIVSGTESATQGGYFVVNDAQVTLSVTAAHATLPRIDIVVINVRDAFYSGASNDVQLQVVAGTPASSPVAPTAPANSITLAQIAVGAAVTSIVNADITDQRFYLAAAGGVINARTDATRPGSTVITEGQLVWTMDNNRLTVWDGSAYQQLYPGGYDKISENVLGSAAASVTFSSIPSTYRNLHLAIICRGDTAATFATMNLRFNSDTGANYATEAIFGQASAAGATESLAQTSMPMPDFAAASAPANHPGIYNITIPWYTSTAFIKLVHTQSTISFGTATNQFTTRSMSGRWASTSAITSITLTPSAGNFITGSSFVLYGIA